MHYKLWDTERLAWWKTAAGDHTKKLDDSGVFTYEEAKELRNEPKDAMVPLSCLREIMEDAFQHENPKTGQIRWAIPGQGNEVSEDNSPHITTQEGTDKVLQMYVDNEWTELKNIPEVKLKKK